jgi:hypothetical protein
MKVASPQALPNVKHMPSPLRRRIVEHMVGILEIIDPENKPIGFGEEGDVRPRIINIIRGIASLTPVPPDRHRTVAARAKKLRSAIAGLPEYAHLAPALSRAIAEGEEKGRAKSIRVSKQRVDLAAAYAYDLMIDHGFGVPTLDENGMYVNLTARFLEAATGRGSSKTAARACARYFKAEQGRALYGVPEEELATYKKNNPYPYSKPGRRAGAAAGAADASSSDFDRWMMRYMDEAIRERKKAARQYPLLDELLDAMNV